MCRLWQGLAARAWECLLVEIQTCVCLRLARCRQVCTTPAEPAQANTAPCLLVMVGLLREKLEQLAQRLGEGMPASLVGEGGGEGSGGQDKEAH